MKARARIKWPPNEAELQEWYAQAMRLRVREVTKQEFLYLAWISCAEMRAKHEREIAALDDRISRRVGEKLVAAQNAIAELIGVMTLMAEISEGKPPQQVIREAEAVRARCAAQDPPTEVIGPPADDTLDLDAVDRMVGGGR